MRRVTVYINFLTLTLRSDSGLQIAVKEAHQQPKLSWLSRLFQILLCLHLVLISIDTLSSLRLTDIPPLPLSPLTL